MESALKVPSQKPEEPSPVSSIPAPRKLNPDFKIDTSKKFLFIRHGETEYNADRNPFTRNENPNYIDVHLSPKGIEQSKSLSPLLNSLDIELIYSSPNYRALQTIYLALDSHPNKQNLKIKINPLITDRCTSGYACCLDIKKTKEEFNMESKIKVDWSFFDEYVSKLKWDENFYYFENLNQFENEYLDKFYQNVKTFYENKQENDLKNELIKGIFKESIERKKIPESVKHICDRYEKFKKYLINEHKETINQEDKKVLVFTHCTLLRAATSNRTYDSDDIKQFERGTFHERHNCEFISINYNK